MTTKNCGESAATGGGILSVIARKSGELSMHVRARDSMAARWASHAKSRLRRNVRAQARSFSTVESDTSNNALISPIFSPAKNLRSTT